MSSSMVSSWSVITSQDFRSILSIRTFRDDYDSSSSQCQTSFFLNSDFGSPSFTSAPTRQSALIWSTSKRKYSTSDLLLVRLLLESYQELAKTFLSFLISKRKNSSSLLSRTRHVGIVIVELFAQILYHHCSGITCAAVDDCDNVRPHLCIVWEQMELCCQLFFKVCFTQRKKNRKS